MAGKRGLRVFVMFLFLGQLAVTGAFAGKEPADELVPLADARSCETDLDPSFMKSISSMYPYINRLKVVGHAAMDASGHCVWVLAGNSDISRDQEMIVIKTRRGKYLGYRKIEGRLPLVYLRQDGVSGVQYFRGGGSEPEVSFAIDVVPSMEERQALVPDFDQHRKNAEAMTANGKLREAEGEYLKILALNPLDSKSRLGLARVHMALQQYDKAEFALHAVFKPGTKYVSHEQRAEAAFLLGTLEEVRGESAAARGWYRRAAELSPESDFTSASFGIQPTATSTATNAETMIADQEPPRTGLRLDGIPGMHAYGVTEREYGTATIYELPVQQGVRAVPRSLDVNGGILWIATDAGLVRHHIGNDKWWIASDGGEIPLQHADFVAASDDVLAVRLARYDGPFKRSEYYWYVPSERKWSRLHGEFRGAVWSNRKLWYVKTGTFGYLDPWNDQQLEYSGAQLEFLASKPIESIVAAGDNLWMAMNDAIEPEGLRFPGGAFVRFDTVSGRFEPIHQYHGAPYNHVVDVVSGGNVVWAAHWDYDKEYEGITRYDTHTGQFELIREFPDGSPIRARRLALTEHYLWFADAHQGLGRINLTTLETEVLPQADVLPADVTGMASVSNGLWISAISHSVEGVDASVLMFIPEPDLWKAIIVANWKPVAIGILASIFVAWLAFKLAPATTARGRAVSTLLLFLPAIALAAWFMNTYISGNAGVGAFEPVKLKPDAAAMENLHARFDAADDSSFEIVDATVTNDAGNELRIEVQYRNNTDMAQRIHIGGGAMLGGVHVPISYNPDPAPPGQGKATVLLAMPDDKAATICTDSLFVQAYSPDRTLAFAVYPYRKFWIRQDVGILDRALSEIGSCD